MTIKKTALKSVIISILATIVLSGCAKQVEPEVTKSNANQSTTILSNSNVTVNNIPENNNVSANPANIQESVVNNAPTTILNKNNSSLPSVNNPKPQIGSGSLDFGLFAQVRNALSSDKELFDSIKVELKEGSVILTGNVSSAAQKTKAEQLIQNIKGIKSVKNNLRVGS